MSGPQYFDDPVSGTAVPAQAPIDVFADDEGTVFIQQFQWREGEVFISCCPEYVFALCSAILEAAGFDPDLALREPSKDAGGKERQRRRRQKQRDSHGQDDVTVTAKLADDVGETHQQLGPSAAS